MVERTNSWHNPRFKKLALCTERRTCVIDAFIALAGAVSITRHLLARARHTYRWTPGRATALNLLAKPPRRTYEVLIIGQCGLRLSLSGQARLHPMRAAHKPQIWYFLESSVCLPGTSTTRPLTARMMTP